MRAQFQKTERDLAGHPVCLLAKQIEEDYCGPYATRTTVSQCVQAGMDAVLEEIKRDLVAAASPITAELLETFSVNPDSVSLSQPQS